MEIIAWLHSLGLERYAAAFRANDIDLHILPQLTAEDLTDLGVVSVGHRRKLLGAAATLRPGSPPAGVMDTPTPRNEPDEPPAPTVAEAERRQLTVVFCDLVGSTDLSTRLDPEDLREVLLAYQDCCANIIGSLGGHVTRYLGDGVLAYFGYPKADGDDAERAIRAGLDLTRAVRKLQPHKDVLLQARVGIATGVVVVGDLVGTYGTDEQAATGETPNLAARLQALAVPGAVVIAEGTRKLVGGLFDYKDLGGHRLKGFASPVPAWHVVGERQAASRFEALRVTGPAPFVGRETEVALLLGLWRYATTGRGQVALVSGEPGIGKSRLAYALRDRLADEPHAFRSYQCSPLRQNSPLFPVTSRLERAAGFDRDDAPDARLAKLVALLSRTTAQCDGVSLIADLLALPVDGLPPLPDLSPQRRKEKLLETLVMHLVGLAAQRPVLMLFEDVQWCDPTSLEFLGLAIERIRHLPVLLIVTFRPEFQPRWEGLPDVTSLALADLDQHEARVLVERIVGDKALPVDVVDQIVKHADGVPLFVEELTKAVIEADWRQLGTMGALPAAPLPARAVPATLHASLLARLDRLGPAKEIAQIGAVIGRDFSYELLAPVAQRAETELRIALDRLSDAGLVFRKGALPRASFVFKHALVQDAAYATLLRAKRRDLHGRVVRVLEALFPDTAAESPGLLAHHCVQAGMDEKAVYWYLKAGQQAAARSAMVEAVALLERGLELLANLPESDGHRRQELELQLALGSALIVVRGSATLEVGRIYARAYALCRLLDDHLHRQSALFGLWMYQFIRSDLTTALKTAKELKDLARHRGDVLGQAMGHRNVGASLLMLGHFRAARMHLDRSRQILAEHRSAASAYNYTYTGYTGTLLYLSRTLCILGNPDLALLRTQEALHHAEELSHPGAIAQALHAACAVHCLRRDHEDLMQQAEALIGLANDQGFSFWLSMGRIWRARALAETGAINEGISQLHRSMATVRNMGWTIGETEDLCALAGMYGKLGRPAMGIPMVAEAMQIAVQSGQCRDVAELYRIKGELLHSLGSSNDEMPEACLHHSLVVAQRQAAKLWELRAGVSLARLWRDRDERAKVRGLLGPIYGWFTEGFETPDLREAKALLDGLD